MIDHRAADILASGAARIVIPVNCVGVAGKGLALAAAQMWPAWATSYRHACRARMLRPGDVDMHYAACTGAPPVSFATKAHWRAPSQIEWIRQGLPVLAEIVRQTGPESIAIPALGCGLGGLAWTDVRPLICEAAETMSASGVNVWIYEPEQQRRKQ